MFGVIGTRYSQTVTGHKRTSVEGRGRKLQARRLLINNVQSANPAAAATAAMPMLANAVLWSFGSGNWLRLSDTCSGRAPIPTAYPTARRTPGTLATTFTGQGSEIGPGFSNTRANPR